MTPPSNPYFVINSSPRTVLPADVAATFLRGLPSAIARNFADQGPSHPTFEGENGAKEIPIDLNCPPQVPSEPVCGQEAPPHANTTTPPVSNANSPPLSKTTSNGLGPRN